MSDQLRRLLEALSDPAAPLPGQPPGSAYDIPIELNESWRQFVRTWSTDQDDAGLQLASELQVGGRVSIVVALETLLGITPAGARPVMLVDESGQPISATNPLPVSSSGGSELVVIEGYTRNLSLGTQTGNPNLQESSVNGAPNPPGMISHRVATVDVSGATSIAGSSQNYVVYSSATGQGGWRERVAFGLGRQGTNAPTSAQAGRDMEHRLLANQRLNVTADEDASTQVLLASFDVRCLWNTDQFWKVCRAAQPLGNSMPAVSIELNMDYQTRLVERQKRPSKRRNRQSGPLPLPKSAAALREAEATADDREPEE